MWIHGRADAAGMWVVERSRQLRAHTVPRQALIPEEDVPHRYPVVVFQAPVRGPIDADEHFVDRNLAIFLADL